MVGITISDPRVLACQEDFVHLSIILLFSVVVQSIELDCSDLSSLDTVCDSIAYEF